MNLVWHLIKTDLRRQRWLSIVWLAGVVLRLACDAYRLSLPSDPPWLEGLINSLGGLSLLAGWALTVVLTARLILADPLRGTTAFWFTRPISAGTLLSAKSISAGLLVVVPTLLQFGVCAAFGLGARTLLVAALETAMPLAVAVTATAAFAVLAESFGRFVVNALVTLAAAIFCAAWALSLSPISLVDGRMVMTDTQALSQLWMFKAAVLLVGGGFVGWRFFRRHARYGTAVSCLGTFWLLILPWFCPWDFLRPDGPTEGELSLVRPTLTLSSPIMQVVQTSPTTVTASGEVECVAQGELVFEPLAMRSPAALKWPAEPERRVSAANTRPPGPMDLATASPASLQRALGSLRIVNPLPKASRTINALWLQPEIATRLGRESATLTGAIDAKRRRFVIEAESPVAIGIEVSGEPWRVRVEQIKLRDGAFRLLLRERSYLSALVGEPEGHVRGLAGLLPASRPLRHGRAIYLLANRARGEALLPRQNDVQTRFARLDHLFVWQQACEFPMEQLGVAADEWLRGATLLRVRVADLGYVKCPFVANNVTLKF